MTTLKQYVDVARAELDKSLLEAAGIPAFIADENSAALGYGAALGGVRLQVADADVDRARHVLQEHEGATPLPDDFIPPKAPPEETSRLKVEDPDSTRIVRSVIVTLLFVFAMFVGFGLWKSSHSAIYYYNQGVAKARKGDFDGAIADYDRAIELKANFTHALDNRGSAKQSKGELDGAIADYNRAIELDSYDVHAYDNRGVAKRAKGDLEGALADFDKSIELDPGNAHAYNNRALIKQARGNLDGAIADCDRAIELDAKDAQAYNNRGLARRAKNDLDGAITDYDRAIELNPRYVHAYLNRGSAARAKGNLDNAIADDNHAIELDPKNAHAYYNRGFTEKAKGDLDGAIADYNRAIALDPKDVHAYDSRGFAKRMKGDLDGSLADYNRAIELDPKNTSAYYGRGVDRYDSRNWSEALPDFRKTSSLTPATSKSETLPDYASIRIWMTRSKLSERTAATEELKQYLLARTIGKPGDWLSTIIRLLTGEISENALFKAADVGDEKQTRDQKCEAYFYVGTLRLLDGDKSAAADYFKKCLDTGVKDFYEYQSASAELQFLNSGLLHGQD